MAHMVTENDAHGVNSFYMAHVGDGKDAHGVLSLRSCCDGPHRGPRRRTRRTQLCGADVVAHMGSEATRMAYPACDADVIAHMGSEAAHMAYSAMQCCCECPHVVRVDARGLFSFSKLMWCLTWGPKRHAWRTQLCEADVVSHMGSEATDMTYPACEAVVVSHMGFEAPHGTETMSSHTENVHGVPGSQST